MLIGALSVTSWAGRIHLANRRVRVLDAMPGVDGSLVVRSAWRADPSLVRTSVSSTSKAAAFGVRDQYRAMEGTAITVIDPLGEVWDVTVIKVDIDVDATVLGTYRVRATWMLLPITEEA